VADICSGAVSWLICFSGTDNVQANGSPTEEKTKDFIEKMKCHWVHGFLFHRFYLALFESTSINFQDDKADRFPQQHKDTDTEHIECDYTS
jgi:hypothetical protein